MSNMREIENQFISEGKLVIAGCDEAGRGPVAGPLVVASCVLPNDFFDERINDSKKISEKKRDELYNVIIENAVAYKIVIFNEREVDKLNVYQASKLGMERGVNELGIDVDFVLTDAMPLNKDIPHLSIIKGDSKSISIAAASILAKVTRDRIMIEYDQLHPEYGFKKHKGYLTKQHKEALEQFGYLDIHRQSFEPIKSMIQQQLSLDL